MRMTFSTPQGIVEDDFPIGQPIRALKAEVLARLRLPAEWAEQYIVACEGETLDEGKTLAELDLPEDSTVVVWRVSSTRATGA